MRALKSIEDKLENSLLFGRLSLAKRMELADAIYMSAVRSDTSIDTVLTMIKTRKAFNEAFFGMNDGKIFAFVHRDLRAFAEYIFHKIAGGGTPNAAMGKGELLLLLLSENTWKPSVGDIAVNSGLQTVEIEVKVNAGKLGLGSCKDAHAAVVKLCNRRHIQLPLSVQGKYALGHPRFIPNNPADRARLDKSSLSEVLAVWWKAISSGEELINATWPIVRKAFLKKVAEQNISHDRWLLVMDNDGNFRFFRKPSEFVRFYNHDKTTYEYRAHHDKEFSIYLNLAWP